MLERTGRLLLPMAAALCLTGCGGQTANQPQTAPGANASPAAPNAAGTAANSAVSSNASANTNASANANAQGGNDNVVGNVGEVTRISFPKGATSGTASVALPPGGVRRFAVEGTYGQKIKVSADSRDAIVKMISGTDRQVESAGGGLVLEITVGGDVIFEVRNASASELNTTVRVEITRGY